MKIHRGRVHQSPLGKENVNKIKEKDEIFSIGHCPGVA